MEDMEQLFREAFERHADELFRHASLRLSDRDRALELTQEAFLRAWQYAGRGEEILEIRPFLFRTLRNLIIDEYRKKKSFSLDEMIEADDGGQIESNVLRDETDALENAIGRFDGGQALEMIRQLPDIYAEVLAMRYIDERTVSEIAT